MRDQTEAESHILDTYLAAFTDDLTSGPSLVDVASQPGMEDLEEIVRQLHSEIQLVNPDSDVRDRIHSNLLQEWNQAHTNRTPSVLNRWWQSITGGDSWGTQRQSQRLSTFALVGVVIVVLIFLTVSSIDTFQTLPASVTGDISFGAVAISIGVLVAASAWFFSRRKR
jgi:hypothetical protein